MKSKIPQIKKSFFALVIIAALSLGFVVSPLVTADRFDEQIKQIQAANSVNRQNVRQLQIQADSYQGEIDRLQGEINTVRAQIRASEARRDDLQNQIKAAEEELARQKVLLGENIKAIYVEGQISTLEMLDSTKKLN